MRLRVGRVEIIVRRWYTATELQERWHKQWQREQKAEREAFAKQFDDAWRV